MVFENMRIKKMYISAFFFFEESAKINVELEIYEKNDLTAACFDIKPRENVYDLLLLCPEWKDILKLNDIEFQQTKNYANEYEHRIINPRAGDVITLNIEPIIIKDVILDWKIEKGQNDCMLLTLLDYR